MKFFSILLLLFLTFSCKKDALERDKTGGIKASVCGVDYPVRELPWLRKLIAEAKDRGEGRTLTVKLVEVNGRPIFSYYLSYSSCWGCINYLCDGSLIDINTLPAGEIQEFKNKIVSGQGEVTILWPED